VWEIHDHRKNRSVNKFTRETFPMKEKIRAVAMRNIMAHSQVNKIIIIKLSKKSSPAASQACMSPERKTFGFPVTLKRLCAESRKTNLKYYFATALT